MAILKKVNLADKFALFSEHWSPKVVGELNGQEIKLVKIKGEFIWHRHEHEDELFLVHRGAMRIELRHETVQLSEGEFYIVPRGVEHKPAADQEAELLMFEPSSTLNTGQHTSERTIISPEAI